VDQVVVFGRAPEKPAKISGQFGFAITTDLDAVIADASVDLIDICLPAGTASRTRSRRAVASLAER
jgi:predicted dehydrogenase